MTAETIDRGLFRFQLPMKEITTSVFLVSGEEGACLIDSGTCAEDVEKLLLPEISGFADRIQFLLVTHAHRDHSGGLACLAAHLPEAVIATGFPSDLPRRIPLRDGDRFPGGLVALLLPGHTADSFGFFHEESRTLFSGDCLQLSGISVYRNGIRFPEAYRESVGRLKKLGLKRIVASHEYDPLGSLAQGEEAVLQYLEECLIRMPASP